ncbi:MAG: hypothetical protein U0T56_11965 [Ferruginibacter sp.]
MTYQELIKGIYHRIRKTKLLILLCGFILAVLLFLYARGVATVYTSRASVFPLTASNDNNAASTALSGLLGLSETPKSFSQDASINIVELAQSRNTREAVALERIPDAGNKTVAELLVENYNRYKPFYRSSVSLPKDQSNLAAVGGNLLKNGFAARINKNGILEINFSCTDEKLVGPISYLFVDKISEFYKELKIKKARQDYDFTVRKIDSLEQVLGTYDSRAIHMSKTTLFTTPERIEYHIPKENLVNEKDRVMRQRDAAANNREEALWRMQKVTPIIAILDKPDPPYDVKKPSSVLYAMIGFLWVWYLP